MPGAHSADLRERVLLLGARGRLSRARIAALFQVAESTVYRWLQTWRREGRREPKPHAGGPAPRLDEAALQKLAAIVAEANDLSLDEYAQRLRERAGERADHLPGAAEAGPAPQKRACGRRSRTGPTSSPPGLRGGPNWPSSIRGS
jgi:transposase